MMYEEGLKVMVTETGHKISPDILDYSLMEEALLIRTVENKLLALFSEGKVRGPLHTCPGQEFSAIAFAGALTKDDFVLSNHRGHGHFLAYTKDYYGLMAELLGKETGVSGGIGGTQHLCRGNFFSNGIQGGLIPVAAGLALANKLQKNKNIVVVYIGDGTLGQGVLYETLNMISKWHIPLVIVCENNGYAQSTPQHVNLAGDILKRAEAFSIKTNRADTWDFKNLMKEAANAIQYVRTQEAPFFFLVDTYRLNPHSKGDDTRDKEEVERFSKIDPLNVFKQEHPEQFSEMMARVEGRVAQIVNDVDHKKEQDLNQYFNEKTVSEPLEWKPVEAIDQRQVDLLNQFFKEIMAKDKEVLFIGEDVLSPYGGAFKVAKDLSDAFPDQVISTPISEAGITGIASGLALAGMKPYLEIMFGDFMMLTMDQLVNHASKIYHLSNKQKTCPVVIRTPMGGRRGYGATHSQTLDKFLTGVDNVSVIALNSFSDPREIYKAVYRENQCPTIVIENKTDYGRKIGYVKNANYKIVQTRDAFPVIKITPMNSKPHLTFVTYGGMAHVLLESIDEIFVETDLKSEVIILTRIHPVSYEAIIESANMTRRVFVAEEGTQCGGIGSEIIASLVEKLDGGILAKRIAALPVPIPYVKSLEDQVLPSSRSIIGTVIQHLK
ncbi:MAG: thiamine pyrophosphate-dependent enzyme [Candidatus Omnitrophota bacterium]